MIRYLDVYPNELAVVPQSPALPPVDWACIKKSPPTPLPIPARQPDDPLPSADVVILTWTTAEWSALDHVFLNNQTPRTAEEQDWRMAWRAYQLPMSR